jgi:hypothetical protein
MQKLKALNGAGCISNSHSKAIFEFETEHFAHAVITIQAPPSWLVACRKFTRSQCSNYTLH